MSRTPPEDRWAVISFHKQGLTTAAIRHTTGFDRGFITRCLSKYNDSGSVDDAERAGRPRTLSKGVERTNAEKTTLLESRDRKGAQETEGCRCERKDSAETTVHRRGLHAFKQRKTSRLPKAHKHMSIAVR